jgi:hypothetical protein
MSFVQHHGIQPQEAGYSSQLQDAGHVSKSLDHQRFHRQSAQQLMQTSVSTPAAKN